jgi:hypothetical protein
VPWRILQNFLWKVWGFTRTKKFIGKSKAAHSHSLVKGTTTTTKRQVGKVSSKEEKDNLESALENTTELVDAKLGLYKDEAIHLEIEPSAKPLQHELTLFQSLTKKLSNEKWTTY